MPCVLANMTTDGWRLLSTTVFVSQAQALPELEKLLASPEAPTEGATYALLSLTDPTPVVVVPAGALTVTAPQSEGEEAKPADPASTAAVQPGSHSRRGRAHRVASTIAVDESDTVASVDSFPVEAVDDGSDLTAGSEATLEDTAQPGSPEDQGDVKGYEVSATALEDSTCEECVYEPTCPRKGESGPSTCGSFQWATQR